MYANQSRARFITGLLSLVFSLLVFFPDAHASSLRSAPLIESGTANGMVRVKLSSLGQPSQLSISVQGSYSVSGIHTFSLPQGSQITITFNQYSGQLFMQYDGQSYNMGNGLRLRRHTASGQSGLYIAQSRRPGNLYPGDLSLSVSGGAGTYSLNAVAHIFMEDYLYGVLPYEMGNASHIEALKAQAVTARTYTTRAMSSSGGRSYDVVDTTSDQVYNGTPSGNENCKLAVSATRGIVMRHDGQFSATFYTASNGGQTESPANAWGSSSYTYLQVRDDPYDFANTAASVKTYRVAKQGSLLQEPLLSILQRKAKAQYPAARSIAIQSITSVIPHTPKYATPSRQYTKMDFYVLLDVDGNASTSIVSFDIFGELETALSMSISTLKNELWTVRKEADSFTLEARRFGHGIGMSQRGAMRMGAMGYTYDQIIAFYFPGCSRARYSLTQSILSPYVPGVDSQDLVSENQPAEVGIGDAGYAVVQLRDTESMLSVHMSGDAGSKVIWTLPHGTAVTVLKTDGNWSLIQYGGISGFVQSAYLSVSAAPTGQTTAGLGISGYGLITGTDYLNLRMAPVSTAQVLTTIPKGTILPLFDVSNGWARTQYGVQQGYVMYRFLSPSDSYPGQVWETSQMTGQIMSPIGFALLRSTPSTDGYLLSQLSNGSLVTVIKRDYVWAQVEHFGFLGFIPSDQIIMTGTASETPQPMTTSTPPPDMMVNARVSTPSGSLNLREKPRLDARVVTTIPRGTMLAVSYLDSQWAKTQYAGYNGFVMRSFLSGAADATFPPAMTPSAAPGGQNESWARINSPSQSVLLYAAPEKEPIGAISHGDIASVLQKGEMWSRIVSNGATGYIQNRYLNYDALQTPRPTPAPTAAPGDLQADLLRDSTMIQLDIPVVASVLSGYGSVNLRKGCSTGSTLLREIPAGDVLYVTMRGDTWCAVTHEGVEGFCMTKFLQFDEYY